MWQLQRRHREENPVDGETAAATEAPAEETPADTTAATEAPAEQAPAQEAAAATEAPAQEAAPSEQTQQTTEETAAVQETPSGRDNRSTGSRRNCIRCYDYSRWSYNSL